MKHSFITVTTLLAILIFLLVGAVGYIKFVAVPAAAVVSTQSSIHSASNTKPTKATTALKPLDVTDITKAATTCDHERYAYDRNGNWTKFPIKNATVCHNIVYSSQGLKLDLYLPNDGGSKDLPLLVWVHSGGFYLGGRYECAYDINKFVEKGYAVACVSYRMAALGIEKRAPDEKDVTVGYFPLPLMDVKTAVQYLRKHAGENYNSKEIIVGGHNAGGYFAAMMAVTNGRGEFNGYDDRTTSSDVQGAMIFAGITDFNAYINNPVLNDKKTYEDGQKGAQYMLSLLLGTWPNANADRANPLTYLTSKAVPVFIAHGTNDSHVPYAVSDSLNKAMVKAGVDVTLRTLKGGNHDTVLTNNGVFTDAVRWLNTKFK